MEKEKKEAMDEKRPRRLDFSAPLISIRRPVGFTSGSVHIPRAASRGTSWDICDRIPFSWEQSPGKPKDRETSDSSDFDVPPPKLPPARWHLIQELTSNEGNGHDDDHQCCEYDDGCEGDVDDEDDRKQDGNCSDALDIFSLAESVETTETESCRFRRLSLELKEEFRGSHSPSYIIQRFLPDARALAAASVLEASRGMLHDHSITPSSDTGFSRAVSIRESYSSPKACGLDSFFSWRIKHKPCGMKSPIQPESVKKVKAQLNSRRKLKTYGSFSGSDNV